MKTAKQLFWTITILLSVSFVHGLEFSEIMYNPEGSDTNNEWIKIYNNGNEIDFSDYKLNENNINHGLTLNVGSNIIAPSESIIIARNYNNFIAKYPTFIGTIYTTSFSLRNTGEILQLINSKNEIVDEINYIGGIEDGYSIVKESLNWIKGELHGTPGTTVNIPQVPEFSSVGIIIATIGSILIMRKT